MTVSKEFIENKKEELKKEIASAMVKTLIALPDDHIQQRELHRDVINLFLDFAMYADDWGELDTKALAASLSIYLAMCRQILEEQS